MQREKLYQKGKEPHVLAMSATPIPRTLALILYGDMDLSVIDERPANRLPIKNCAVNTDYRPNAYRFMLKQIEEGRQVYIICPMVEQDDEFELESVMLYTEELKSQFPPSVTIEYLHGKMKPAQKEDIMARYAEGEIDILVSTTVIEVGIDVPNASVIMIENAERFGLAQLHQLRGLSRTRQVAVLLYFDVDKRNQREQGAVTGFSQFQRWILYCKRRFGAPRAGGFIRHPPEWRAGVFNCGYF